MTDENDLVHRVDALEQAHVARGEAQGKLAHGFDRLGVLCVKLQEIIAAQQQEISKLAQAVAAHQRILEAATASKPPVRRVPGEVN